MRSEFASAYDLEQNTKANIVTDMESTPEVQQFKSLKKS